MITINMPTHMSTLETHDLKHPLILKAYQITITLNTNMSLTNSEKLLLCSKQLAYMKEYLYSINGRNKYQYKVISKRVVLRKWYIFRKSEVCDKYPYRGNFFKKLMEKVIFPNVTNIHWERLDFHILFRRIRHIYNTIRVRLHELKHFTIRSLNKIARIPIISKMLFVKLKLTNAKNRITRILMRIRIQLNSCHSIIILINKYMS